MKTVREIIIANEKIYPHTDKRIQINRSRMNDLEFNDFANDLEESFYTQINEMIICLQSDKLMIQQVDKLKEQLIGMSEYFFNQMPFRTNNWDLAQSIDSKLIGKQGIYINPKDFTKEKVIGIVQRLTTENHNKEINKIEPKKKNIENQTWFKVGVELAKGEIHRLKKENKNWDFDDVTIKLFPNEKLSTFRPYVSESWANNPETKSRQKNIFTRTKSDDEKDEIIAYCITQNYKIKHPIFVERERQYRGESNLF